MVLNKFSVLMMMIIKNVEKLPLLCCLVSLFANSFRLASCTQTPRLIINFVPRPLSPYILRCLELPLNFPWTCRCLRQDGVVSSQLQTSTTKKAKPIKKVKDQLEKNRKYETEKRKAYNLLTSLWLLIKNKQFWISQQAVSQYLAKQMCCFTQLMNTWLSVN